MPVRELQSHDVERILRDLMDRRGLQVSFMHAERSPDGWHVTVSDAAGRVISTIAPAGAAAEVRAALTRWADAL